MAQGKPATVDDVLDVPRSAVEYQATRQMVIRRLNDSIAAMPGRAGGGGPGAASEQATIVGKNADQIILSGGFGGSVADAATLAGSPATMWRSSTGESAAGPDGLPQIEGYDIVGRLGRGGMGVVFEGVQQATGRRVAVKFLLDAALASEAARQRFEREVEVVAGLQHPGIVAIIDSGVRKGRYYYVMDYVAGKPLDEALPAPTDPAKIDVRGVLGLFCDICDGVDYAHQRGVLHRDLKPSNILVGDDRKPHILDFGLAKRVEATGETANDTRSRTSERSLTIAEPGQLLGTIAYMSPEQSLGHADQASVRADVYSLGVIAYELVTGRLPIKTDGSLRQVLAKIAEMDPPAPSSVVGRLGRDLDAVLLKALEKSPDRRYATAGELAADIKRYLNNEPVTARRIGPTGRAWRWVKRNQTLAATIAAAAVTLAGVSATLVVRIVQERDRANLKADEAERSKGLAEQRLQESQLNERIASQNFGILRAILESADPESKGEPTVRQLLDGATDRLDKSPPEIDRTEAVVRELLGLVYRKFGDYAKARSNLEKAMAIREKHVPESGNDPALAECLHNLAAVLWWAGEYGKAEPLYERALAMRQRLFPGDSREVAMSLTHLAACRQKLGKHKDSQDLYAQALVMRRRMYGDKHEEVAQGLNNLAKAYLDAEDYEQAEALFRQALDMVVGLKGEQYGGTAATSQNLASCLLEKGDAAGAKAAFARAMHIREALFPSGHHLIAGSLVGVAQSELALKDAVGAERDALRSVEIYKAQKRLEHPDAADAWLTLSGAQRELGRVDESQQSAERALAILVKGLPATGPQAGQAYEALGRARLAAGKWDEGIDALLKSLDAARSQTAGGRRRVVTVAGALAEAYGSRGDAGRADEMRRVAASAVRPKD